MLPSEIDLIYPYINLYEFTALLLHQSFQFLLHNFTNIPGTGWISVWTQNLTLLKDYYYKYYDETKNHMLICNPELVGNYKGNSSSINCYNYTPSYRDDILDKISYFGYVYNSEKPMVDVMITFAMVMVMFGAFGKRGQFLKFYVYFDSILLCMSDPCFCALRFR